ncbi:hypothetical protein B0T18DRAFT_448818 [Schizothecium vesticola]|uniref:C2H2-type domain-containing protein n=1 Tax=Schizothecium vesticola TaxID=314040 RepID=A0AA40BTH3_9PEZI|nr:hypothetical protein B0T18DRAFT_448818 [Schizothecium vesticola]
MQAAATTETMDPGLLRLPRRHSTVRAHSSHVDEDVAAYSPAKEAVRPLDIDDLKKAPTDQALATTISSSHKPSHPLDSAIGLGSSVASNNGLQKLEDLSGDDPCHHGGSIPVADDQEEDTLLSLPYRRAGDGPGSSKRNRVCRRLRQRRKRRNSSDDEDDDDGNGKGNGDNGRGGLAGQGTVARHFHPSEYSCPFRKRSPAMFNVRKHPKCATKSWKTLSDLKKHVTEDHQRVKTFPCLRCGENCGSPEGMQAHWQSSQMCDPKPVVATAPQRWEDGISERTCEILRSRKDEKKVTNWEQLWVVLFGQGVPVEDCGFVPVVELEELLVEFNTKVPRPAGELHERLCSFLGNGMCDQSRHSAGEIADFVMQWINSFHASCRDIPSREQNAAGAQTKPGQISTTEHAAHLGVKPFWITIGALPGSTII